MSEESEGWRVALGYVETEIKTLRWILRAILLHLQAVEIISEMIKEAEKRW